MTGPATTRIDRRRVGMRLALVTFIAAVTILGVAARETDSAMVEAPPDVVTENIDRRPMPRAVQGETQTVPVERGGLLTNHIRPAPTAATTPAAAPAAAPVMVADPTPGDLRVDPFGDVLPLEYEPPPSTYTILDVGYGSDPAQKLDMYLPGARNAPVVVFLHSGGWVGGDKQNVPDMVMRFVERGYAVVAVGYRLAPEHSFPEPVQDVKRAIRWIKAYGDFGGSMDGERIIIYGTSAGGHLAAFVAATPGSYEPDDLDYTLSAYDSSVAGVVSAVGPTDLVSLYSHDNDWARPLTAAFVGCETCSVEELEEASPINQLHPELPPAYWAYGPEDTLIDVESQGIAMATAWAEQAGADSSWLDLVAGQGHNLDESTVNQRAIESFVDFAASRGQSRSGTAGTS